MWWKHRYAFQDNVKYIHNDILEPNSLIIINYAKHVRDINDLYKYLPLPSKKEEMFDQANCKVRYCDFTKYEICVVTKYGLPASIQDEMDEKHADYYSLSHKE